MGTTTAPAARPPPPSVCTFIGPLLITPHQTPSGGCAAGLGCTTGSVPTHGPSVNSPVGPVPVGRPAGPKRPPCGRSAAASASGRRTPGHAFTKRSADGSAPSGSSRTETPSPAPGARLLENPRAVDDGNAVSRPAGGRRLVRAALHPHAGRRRNRDPGSPGEAGESTAHLERDPKTAPGQSERWPQSRDSPRTWPPPRPVLRSAGGPWALEPGQPPARPVGADLLGERRFVVSRCTR